MKRLLVTGASGLLGSAVCAAANERYKVYGTYLSHPLVIAGVEMTRVDLSEPAAVSTLARLEPSIIIHCAALTDVERCEAEPQEARKQNVTAAQNAAEAAKRCGARLVQVSTESVFDGRKGNYIETDAPEPLNVYARTKLEAESAVMKTVPSAAVVRTTLYGWNPVHKPSLAEWILARLESGQTVPGFEDAVFSPIYCVHLAEKLLALAITDFQGILHVAGREAYSKYAFARELAEVFGFDPSRVEKTSLSAASFRAKRPANVSLDVRRAESVLGRMPSVREGLKRFREHRHAKV